MDAPGDSRRFARSSSSIASHDTHGAITLCVFRHVGLLLQMSYRSQGRGSGERGMADCSLARHGGPLARALPGDSRLRPQELRQNGLRAVPSPLGNRHRPARHAFYTGSRHSHKSSSSEESRLRSLEMLVFACGYTIGEIALTGGQRARGTAIATDETGRPFPPTLGRRLPGQQVDTDLD